MAVVLGILSMVGLAIGQLYLRSADACERIAIVETRQDAVDDTLTRIDATLLRMDAKLDKALE